jgi:beta-glucosidase
VREAEMEQNRLVFPKGFVWGTSTAGHQVEGHNDKSDWWKFEQEGKIKDGTRSGKSVDYWNRYEEDHDLMVKLGYQAFRLGIEWAKFEPEDGKFDDVAIERYRKILQSLRAHNLKICLTIYHWVLPLWFAESGGWERPDAVERFVRYAERIVKELGEYPDLWVTLNEPMVPAIAGYLGGEFPPEMKSFGAYGRVTGKLLHAHVKTYEMIHNAVGKGPDGGPSKAGVATAYQWIEPWGSPGLTGVYEKFIARIFAFGSFRGWDNAVASGYIPFPFGREHLAGLKDSYDFCGVNYYFRSSLKSNRSFKDRAYVDMEAIPPGIEKTQMGWQNYPPGFYKTLMEVWSKFKKPIYITENGIADDADAMRPKYLLEHLSQVQRAISEGADIRGYYQWSYIDNFEWKEGFSKKFGLIACDHADPELKRVPRPSAYMYSEIIKQNAITDDIVSKYSPDARDGVFGNKWKI